MCLQNRCQRQAGCDWILSDQRKHSSNRFDTEQPFFDKLLNQYHNQQGFILIYYFTSARFLEGVKTDWKKRTLPYNSFRATRAVDSYYYTANIFLHSNHFFEHRASTKTPNRIKKIQWNSSILKRVVRNIFFLQFQSWFSKIN